MIKKEVKQVIIEVSNEDFEKLGANYINNCKPVTKHEARESIDSLLRGTKREDNWLDELTEFVDNLAFAHKIAKALAPRDEDLDDDTIEH